MYFQQTVYSNYDQLIIFRNFLYQDLKKNIKKYSVSFELQDKMRYSKASKEIIEKRQAQMSAFLELRKQAIETYESQKDERINLRGGK